MLYLKEIYPEKKILANLIRINLIHQVIKFQKSLLQKIYSFKKFIQLFWNLIKLKI